MLCTKFAKHAGRCISSLLVVSALLAGNSALAMGNSQPEADWSGKNNTSYADWTRHADLKWDSYFGNWGEHSERHGNRHHGGKTNVAFFFIMPDTFSAVDMLNLVKYGPSSWFDNQDVNVVAFFGKVNLGDFFEALPGPHCEVPVPAPVPEPETYGLMAAGLGMLGVMAKRRRKTRG